MEFFLIQLTKFSLVCIIIFDFCFKISTRFRSVGLVIEMILSVLCLNLNNPIVCIYMYISG